MAAVTLQQLRKTYGQSKQPAVNNVDMRVADGEFMVLLGPSGCGKTTLLRLIAGLETPDHGSVMIGGRDVTGLPPRKRQIAMVFQSYAVFPHLTVFENIAFGLRMRHEPSAAITRKVAHAAELVQLSDYLGRYPEQLSGGQRQRVAVARAIVMEPAVLLMDEPLSNLDALLRLQFRAELKKLVQELKTTTIYVTHDQVEALSLGDRIAVMSQGDIIQCDRPMQVYDRPATTFVGGFIGTPPMNFLPGRVQREDGRVRVQLGSYVLDGPAALAQLATPDVLVGIRAENVEVSAGQVPDALAACIDVAEPMGTNLLLTLVVGDQHLKVLARNDFPARPGQAVWIRPDPDKLRWFDAQTRTEVRTT